MLINPKGIANFKIEKRILEPATRFSLTLLTKGNPTNLKTGLKILFQMNDLYGSSNPAIVEGRIDTIHRTLTPEKSEYGIDGRDNGLFLDEQPIIFPCLNVMTGKYRTRSFQDILKRICKGTGVKIPGEVNIFKQNFTNKVEDKNHFCGEFKSKKDAIDYLLMRYGELNGLKTNWYRWYLDIEGYIRIFNAYAVNRPTVEFYATNSKIFEINFEEVADRIKNDITVIGGENNSLRKRVYNIESINRYGRRVADVIQDSTLTTQKEVDERAKIELKKQSEEIFVATMKMTGYPHAECGLSVVFPAEPRYSDKRFIITSVVHEGRPGNYTTTIGMSTDENVIVNPNLSDIIKQMIENLSKINCPTIAEVKSVDNENKIVEVQPIGFMSKSIKNKQTSATAKGRNLKAFFVG